MKIQKTTTFSLECLSLEYVLDAILIDNSFKAINAAAAYVWGCKRNSWKDRIIGLDTLIKILAEMGVEYKDIYNDEAYIDLLDEFEYYHIDMFSRDHLGEEVFEVKKIERLVKDAERLADMVEALQERAEKGKDLN